MPLTFLFLLFGATFRHGGHGSPPVPKKKGWRQFLGIRDRQIEATRSQLSFCAYLCKKHNLSASVALSTVGGLEHTTPVSPGTITDPTITF